MENNTYTHIPLWISAFACLESKCNPSHVQQMLNYTYRQKIVSNKMIILVRALQIIRASTCVSVDSP